MGASVGDTLEKGHLGADFPGQGFAVLCYTDFPVWKVSLPYAMVSVFTCFISLQILAM
jgi:hypothetical protein